MIMEVENIVKEIKEELKREMEIFEVLAESLMRMLKSKAKFYFIFLL